MEAGVRPKRICNYPGCGKAGYEPYCQDHKDTEKKRPRPSGKHNAMYNYTWKKMRAIYLKENPLCVICESQGRLTPATVIDHITPHKGDKNLFWKADNYQALCKPCHDRKTAGEDDGFGNTTRRQTIQEPD